ncbi:MAG: agmatinase [Candidatus Bathyarchaeota archaeon]|nr:agmatinase [Candidatus Bathyarchaeota archaeon]
MSNLELFASPTVVFSGLQRELVQADYVVIGVPLDVTSTYRAGSRFAPLAVREASLNIETYSFRAGVALEELKIHDVGDLHITGDIDETLKRIELVTEETLKNGKTPVLIGGEHTITLGAVKGIRNGFAVLCFDAHLDLRDEYVGQKVCHATVMRRINEAIKPLKIIEVGTRAVCKEEIKYAKEQGVTYMTSHQILQDGVEKAAKEINSLLADCNRAYLTIDMDILDPAFAPAVQNPEPEGLSTHVLLDLLSKTCNRRVVGFDMVEVSPHYDTGATAIQAAKIMFEILSYVHMDRKGNSNSV